MAEPQIRYVRSADGTNIAYSTLGEGRPLVWIISPTSMQTVGVDQHVPRVRASLNRLAEGRMVVRIEPRGRGLSDHDVADRSLDAHVADVRTVIDLVGSPVDLVSEGSGDIGVACAARHAERVRRLVLPVTIVHGAALSMMRITRELADNDFELFKKVIALRAYGWDEGKVMASLLARLSYAEWAPAVDAGSRLDASGELAGIRCPTLVLHFSPAQLQFDSMRSFAASIPTAELRVFDTDSATAYDEKGMIAEAIIEFLDRDNTPRGDASLPSGTVIILVSDIVDSTALTERMGDAAFRERSRALDEAIRSIIRESGGTTIDAKTLGDGVLSTFASASQAIRAALALEAAAAASELQLHVGLHAGDVIREQDNVFGGAVNIAARISAMAAPGEVLVSDIVRGLARTSAGVTFEDRGEHALKGVADAQRVFAVQASESRT